MAEKQVVTYDITDAAIGKMEHLYMGLVVKDVDDDEGFKAVHKARKVVKSHRVGVEKRRKELKADALSWGRKVDGEANRIKDLLSPIENHLKAQEKIVTDEQARIQAERDTAFEKKINNRMEVLAEYGRHISYQDVATMDNELWDETLSVIKMEWETEQARIAEEKTAEAARQAKIEAEQKAEANRLEKVRIEQEELLRKVKEEQDKVTAELAAKQAKIDAKEKALQNEKNRIEAEQMAAEFAKAEKIRAEQEAKEEERLGKEAAERAEQLKPDKEKLAKWAGFFDDVTNNPLPILQRIESRSVLICMQDDLEEMIQRWFEDIENL